MDDLFLFANFIYLALVLICVSLIPSDLFQAQNFTPPNAASLQEEYNLNTDDIDNTVEQLGFFKKFLTFFFVSWEIKGIPIIVGLIITFINIISISIPVIWLYDKARGIGS